MNTLVNILNIYLVLLYSYTYKVIAQEGKYFDIVCTSELLDNSNAHYRKDYEE